MKAPAREWDVSKDFDLLWNIPGILGEHTHTYPELCTCSGKTWKDLKLSTPADLDALSKQEVEANAVANCLAERWKYTKVHTWALWQRLEEFLGPGHLRGFLVILQLLGLLQYLVFSNQKCINAKKQQSMTYTRGKNYWKLCLKKS